MKNYVTLGEVCSKGSSNIAQKDIELNTGKYSIFGASGYIKDVDFYHQENPYVAVVKDGAGIGRTMLLPAKTSVIGTMQYLIPNELVDVKYLYYAVTYMNLSKYFSGATIPHIYFKDYRKELLPLPTIEQQKVITSNLSKVDKLITLCKSLCDRFDLIVKSRFVEMFGDPEADTCTYKTTKLKELAVKISDGVHSKPEYTNNGKPFLSVVNINRKRIDFSDCKYVSEEAYQKMIKSTHPEKGDVLYTKVGATYGIPAYVDTEKEFCLYVSVCLIKPKHELINSKFLAIQMDMPYIKHQADRRIKGIGVPDLHLNQISDFDIIVPPRKLQDSFVAFVEQIDKSKYLAERLKKNIRRVKIYDQF